MVDKRRMSTGCATRAAIPIGAGSHSYRVIAQNRYGARSSRSRPFSATTAAGSVNRTGVGGQLFASTSGPAMGGAISPAGTARARAARLISFCHFAAATPDVTEGPVIPTRIDFSVETACSSGVKSGALAYIVNSRNARVSGVARCLLIFGTCRAHGTYRPKLGRFTRELDLRGRLVFFKQRGLFIPTNLTAFNLSIAWGSAHRSSFAPVEADEAEQAVLDLVPLRCSWREMADAELKSSAVGEALQLVAPQPGPRVV